MSPQRWTGNRGEVQFWLYKIFTVRRAALVSYEKFRYNHVWSWHNVYVSWFSSNDTMDYVHFGYLHLLPMPTRSLLVGATRHIVNKDFPEGHEFKTNSNTLLHFHEITCSPIWCDENIRNTPRYAAYDMTNLPNFTFWLASQPNMYRSFLPYWDTILLFS